MKTTKGNPLVDYLKFNDPGACGHHSQDPPGLASPKIWAKFSGDTPEKNEYNGGTPTRNAFGSSVKVWDVSKGDLSGMGRYEDRTFPDHAEFLIVFELALDATIQDWRGQIGCSQDVVKHLMEILCLGERSIKFDKLEPHDGGIIVDIQIVIPEDMIDKVMSSLAVFKAKLSETHVTAGRVIIENMSDYHLIEINPADDDHISANHAHMEVHKRKGVRHQDWFSSRYSTVMDGRDVLNKRYGYFTEDGWADAVVPYIKLSFAALIPEAHDLRRLPQLGVMYGNKNLENMPYVDINGFDSTFKCDEDVSKILLKAPSVLISETIVDFNLLHPLATCPPNDSDEFNGCTLLMLSPDLPIACSDTSLPGAKGPRLLWLVTGIRNGDVSTGVTICDYKPCLIYKQHHRYIFLLFQGSVDPATFCEDWQLGNWGFGMRDGFSISRMLQHEGNTNLRLLAFNFFLTKG